MEAAMASFRNALLTCGALVPLTLAACGRESPDEMSWARAALERNSRLEVVAADRETRTFTVRLKDSGELRMVRLDQVVAAPPPAVAAATPAPEHTAAAAGSAAQTASGPNSGASSGAAPAQASAPAAPAVSARAATAQPASLAPQTGPTIETAPGRVLEAGPGYTIKAAPSTAGMAGGGRDSAVAAGVPLERRHEPIVCQGARLLHIDNRNLLSDGDAVSAEDGCEVYITNSRIRATGVGVSARRANVHIDNSLIEGDEASIEASEGAQVYAGATRFKGLSRRLGSAAFHDLGGNVWN
jgi:hypothetical protein